MLDLTLGSLMQIADVSVKLQKCILKSKEPSVLTVRAALNKPEFIYDKLRDVRGSGPEVVLEFRNVMRLLSKRSSDSQQRNIDLDGLPAKVNSNFDLHCLLDLIAFPDAVLNEKMSQPLQDTLEHSWNSRQLGSPDVSDVRSLANLVEQWSEFRSKFLRIQNSGQDLLSELEDLVVNIITKRISTLYPDCPVLPQFSIEDLHDERLVWELTDLIQDARCTQEVVPDPVDVGDHARKTLSSAVHDLPAPTLSPREHTMRELSRLRDEERAVILRRLGLSGFERQTLEQLADQFHTTRERVRQVEAAALRRLCLANNQMAFQELLYDEQDAVWKVLSCNSGLIMPADLEGAEARLAPEFALAVVATHGTLAIWAGTVGCPAFGGFLHRRCNLEETRKDVAALNVWAETAPGPCQVDLAVRRTGMTLGRFQTASRACRDVRQFEGYVCTGRLLGPQTTRTCRLHSLAVSMTEGLPVDSAALRREYRNTFPDDHLTAHAMVETLKRAPHLFFCLYDSLWVPLDGVDKKRHIREVPFNHEPYDEAEEFDPESIEQWLYTIFAEKGPQRTSDLRRHMDEPRNDVAPSDIGEVLQSNPEFIRLMPGIYGLRRHLSETGAFVVQRLTGFFSDAQCRYYAYSRMAGDPVALYPVWGPRFEATLCQWAAANAAPDTFRSLMAVALPELWPLPASERTEWLTRQQKNGVWRLSEEQSPCSRGLPTAEEFVAALLFANCFGAVGWTSVNRTAERRLDSQAAISTLTLLIGMGLVEAPTQWQQRHPVTRETHSLLVRILDNLSETGELSWEKGPLGDLRDQRITRELGWARHSELITMLK
jgi:hypothetical protein